MLSQKRLIILLAAFLLTRLPPALLMPFVLDEALYGPMIGEQADSQKLVPTFLAHPVSWKPFLFFSAYSFMSFAALPLELQYRLPSLVFGLLTIPLILRIFRNCRIDPGISFYSVLAYLFSFPVLYANAAVLTDTLAFFLICLSLCIYTEAGSRARYLFAGAAAFAAFFVKLVLAFLIPVLALAYFLQYRRKEISGGAFLLSLLAVPLALLAHFLIMDEANLAAELYLGDVGGHLVSARGLEGQIIMALESLNTVFSSGLVLWLGISLPGFLSRWRENIFFSAWYLLSIVPLFAASTIFWYFLPLMPAIAYFAVRSLSGGNGNAVPDRFFLIVLSLFLAASLAVSFFNYAQLYSKSEAERESGLLVSSDEDVLIVGTYRPGIVAYNILAGPEGKDFGWVVVSSQVSAQDALIYIEDYRSARYPAIDGSFSAFFTRDAVFRKDTNLTRFGTVVVAGPHEPLAGADLVYNKSEISVYRVK